MRKKIILLVFILFAFASLARAQNTTVTATVTDTDGQAWFNGTYNITFVANPSFSGPYNFNGVPMTPAQQGPYTGTLDNTGSFTVSLPSNALIAPSGTQWLFVICPYASAKCGQITTAVSGASVNLTTLLSNGVPAPRFSAVSAGAYGYSTTEIKEIPVPGGSFWNVTLLCQMAWNGSTFACTSGGAANPGAPGLSLQFANPGGTGFQSAHCSVNGVSATFEIDSGTSTTRLDDPCNTFFASGVPYYDVQSAVFGGLPCDGVTDITAQVTAALAAMSAHLTTGGPGVLYFSRGSGQCLFNGNVFATVTGNTPKYVLMDNNIKFTGPTVFASGRWTFMGHAGPYNGLGGTLSWGNAVTWSTTGNFPSLDLAGNYTTFRFEGINFIGDNANIGQTAPPVHIHDITCTSPGVPANCGGPSYIAFSYCQANPATANQIPFVADVGSNNTDTSVNVMTIDHSNFVNISPQTLVMSFTNAGDIQFYADSSSGGGIFIQNTGIGLDAGYYIDGWTAEDIANSSFLQINSSGGQNVGTIRLKNMQLADIIGTSYVMKNTGNATSDILIEGFANGTFGSGIIDPASSGGIKGMTCLGYGCDSLIAQKSKFEGLFDIPGDGNGAYFYQNPSGPAFPSLAADGGMGFDLATISTNTTLSYNQYGYAFTGSPTLTIPQLPSSSNRVQNQWFVFNKGAGTGTLACSAGNINGSATITLGAQAGAIVTSDGTDCMANMGSSGSSGSLPPGITSWNSVSECYDPGGTLLWQYDPLNLSGNFQTFQCIPNPRLNAVIQTPSNANGPNVIQPGDLTVPNLTLQLAPSQTQPFMIFLNSAGSEIGYLDNAMNLGVNSVQLLGSAVSDLKQSAAPSGSAQAGRDFFYVGTDKLWHTKDDAGLDTTYIGAASPVTLTQKLFDTAGAGNNFKINGTGITGISGSTSTVGTVGTFTGSSGTLVCKDGSGNLTTSGCAGTVTSLRCVADEHCTSIESSATALTAVGDVATSAGTGGGSFSGGIVGASFGANVSASTTTTPNATIGFAGGALYRTGRNIDFVFNGGFSDGSSGVTNSRLFLCMTDKTFAAQMASATPTGNFACFRYDTGASDTVWEAQTNNNSTLTSTGTGVTPDNNQHKFEIQFNDSTPNVVFSIDGTIVATITTTLPSASTNLKYSVGYENLSTNNGNFQVSSVFIRSDK